MRRSRALAGGLALVCVAAPGCGMSTAEETKPRDPAGQGGTSGPDVAVESTDELRTAAVVFDRGRFQPQQVSVGLDSTVRITNRSGETVRLRALEGLVKDLDNEADGFEDDALRNRVLTPGESAEVDFLRAGTERIAARGSDARLEINVFE